MLKRNKEKDFLFLFIDNGSSVSDNQRIDLNKLENQLLKFRFGSTVTNEEMLKLTLARIIQN
jgi:hypothetical protein